MTLVLQQVKKQRSYRPKCEEITAAGHRCKFNAIQFVGGLWRCRRHPGVGK